MVSQNDRPEPRKETFMQMLKYTFCPGITMKYFISLITIAQILTFLLCDIGTFAESKKLNPEYFLGPDQSVYKLFNMYPYDIVNSFQIWRLLTPVMLHVGFSHIVFNMITQIIFGSLLEQMVGFKHIAGCYFISA